MSDNFNPDEFIQSSAPESQGFDPDAFAKDELQQQQYGTPGQQAIAGAEGLAKGLAGPLATAAETKLLGVAPEDIEARAQANPITHYGSEAVGLVGGSVLPVLGEYTQAGVLSGAGKAVASGLGLEGAAATAAKLGVENALYTIGDEVSKNLTNNPASIQSAAMHVGLSGLLGATLGAGLGKVGGTWVNKIGPKADSFVEDLSSRLKMLNGEVPAVPEIPLEESLPLTPGMKAADFINKQAGNAAAETLAGGTGAVLGHLSGIPGGGYMGSLFGHYALKPLMKTIMPTLIKPLLKMAPSGEGLASALDSITAVAKGEHVLDDAAKALFEVGGNKLIKQLQPDTDEIKQLQSRLDQVNKQPESILNVGGALSRYMPAHATALTATVQSALNYLNSQKPPETQPGVLDRKVSANPMQESNYKSALEVAESPLSILHKVQNGSLLPTHVEHLKALYPAIFPGIVKAVTDGMLVHLSDGHQVPYKMRSGLSMLIGQPVDSTFGQPGMASIQSTFAQAQPPQMPQKARHSTSKLGKSVEMAQTPSEARQSALNKG